MSHISQFDSEARLEECAVTATKGLTNKKALWESYMVQTPRSTKAKLISRRISFQPDLQIGVEDEDHTEEIHRECPFVV